MAWQFRRSFKLGPFRINFGKSGISTSVGVPGLRGSINSKGEKHVTTGIPGTGIYERKKISGASPTAQADSEIDRITQEAYARSSEIVAEQKRRYPWFRFYGPDQTPITSFVDACNKIRLFCPRHSLPGVQVVEEFELFKLCLAPCGCWLTITGAVQTPCRYFAKDSETAAKYFSTIKETIVWANDNDKLHKYSCRYRSDDARGIFFDKPASKDFTVCNLCKPSRVSTAPDLGQPMVPLPPVNRFVLEVDVDRCLSDPKAYLSDLEKLDQSETTIEPPPVIDSPTLPKVKITCNCGAKLVAPPSLFGKTIRCPKCKTAIKIPERDSDR